MSVVVECGCDCMLFIAFDCDLYVGCKDVLV